MSERRELVKASLRAKASKQDFVKEGTKELLRTLVNEGEDAFMERMRKINDTVVDYVSDTLSRFSEISPTRQSQILGTKKGKKAILDIARFLNIEDVDKDVKQSEEKEKNIVIRDKSKQKSKSKTKNANTAKSKRLRKQKSQKKQAEIQKIIRICDARIAYNKVFAEFYEKESFQTIRNHLIQMLGNDLEIDPEVVHGIRLMSKGALSDSSIYTELKDFIAKEHNNPELFEEIHCKMRLRIFENKEHQKSSEKIQNKFKKTANGIIHRRYLESEEYKEGFELPLLQEIAELTTPWLSDCYKLMLNFSSFTLTQLPKSTARVWVYVPKYQEYRKLIEHEVDICKASIKVLMSKKIEIAKPDLSQLLNFNGVSTEIKQFMKHIDFDETDYKVSKKYFASIFAFHLKVKAKIAAVQAILEKYLAPKIEAKPIPPEASATPLKSEKMEELQDAVEGLSLDEHAEPAEHGAQTEHDVHDEHKEHNEIKKLKLEQTRKSWQVAPTTPYFDYKRAFASKGSSKDAPKEALSSKKMSLLNAIFAKDVPDFEISFKELESLVVSLGGSKLGKNGSRVRYELNGIYGDTLEDEGLSNRPSRLPLHATHGKDTRNDKASKLTLLQFRSLFERAGVKSLLEKEQLAAEQQDLVAAQPQDSTVKQKRFH